MAKKTALTPATLDALTSGSLADLHTPGLAIEVLPSGKKRWRYRRRIFGKDLVAKLFGGLYPVTPIADARAWARSLNEEVEAGLDPRVTQREEKALAEMTVAKAHTLYMIAVREGRTSRKKGPARAMTIKLKLGVYRRDIAPKLGKLSIHEVTEADLIKIVEAKGKTKKVSANQLAREFNNFFKWATSLIGNEIGLRENPAARLKDLQHAEYPRTRTLSEQELG